MVQETQGNGRPLRLVLSLEEGHHELHWQLADQWAPLAWVDPGDQWELLVQEALEGHQDQCIHHDTDLMVPDQVDLQEVQIAGALQVGGHQGHLVMLRGKMEALLEEAQAHAAQQDHPTAGLPLQAWGDGECPHGVAHLADLAQFHHLVVGMVGHLENGDLQVGVLLLLAHLGELLKMVQANLTVSRATTTWRKFFPCLRHRRHHPQVKIHDWRLSL